MKCSNCNKDFIAKRKTAKFCSDKCRVYFSRVKEVSEALKTAPVPVKSRFGLSERGEVKQFTCKHGFPPKFCKFATAGKPCK